MNKEWDIAFINEFALVLDAVGTSVSVTDVEGTHMLIVELDGNHISVGYTLTVEHPDENSTSIYIMFPMFSGLDRETADKLIPLLRYLNKFLSIGCFVISADNGDMYFRHSFVADESMDRSILFTMAAETIDIEMETAKIGMETIYPVLNGITSVSDLLNDDTAITQQ